MFQTFITEVFGILFPTALAYAITLNYPLLKLSPELDQQTNQLYFCLFPSVVYLVYRVYLGVIYIATQKINEYNSSLGKFYSRGSFACNLSDEIL